MYHDTKFVSGIELTHESGTTCGSLGPGIHALYHADHAWKRAELVTGDAVGTGLTVGLGVAVGRGVSGRGVTAAVGVGVTELTGNVGAVPTSGDFVGLGAGPVDFGVTDALDVARVGVGEFTLTGRRVATSPSLPPLSYTATRESASPLLPLSSRTAPMITPSRPTPPAAIMTQ